MRISLLCGVLFLVLLVLAVAQAVASPGISSFWGNTTLSQTEGGRFNTAGPRGIAIYEATGDVYVADRGNHRIQQFSANGNFIRAWGFDVDLPAASPASSASFEICTVKANCKQGVNSGITPTNGLGGELSGPAGIAINQTNGHVYVSDVSFNRVQEFTSTGTFVRAFGQDVINGGGTGFEVCTVAASCKAGTTTGALGGTFQSIGYPAVTPSGSPNAGDVLVPNAGKLRVDEFTSEGAFVRAWGWDVLVGGTTGFEICANAANCKVGISGSGVGQFGNAINRIAEDTAGNIYTLEAPANTSSGNFRLQKFTQAGGVLTPLGPFCGVGYVPGVGGGEFCGTSSVGLGARDNPSEVAVDDAGFVYVVKAFQVGTGNPAPIIPPEAASLGRTWQQRILKIDPAGNGGSGQVVEAMVVNPGQAPGVEGDGGRIVPEDFVGMAVRSGGMPLYLTTTGEGAARPRVYRLEALTGLSALASVGAVGASTVLLDGTVTPANTPGPVTTGYHFEYRRSGTTGWLRFPNEDVVLGNGTAGGTSSSCSAQSPAATCHVSQEIDGLELGQTYEFRIVATTTYHGAEATSPIDEFTTEATPPTATTGTAVWSGPPSTKPSLTFNGRLNSQGAETTYAFQYVDQAEFEAHEYTNAQLAPVAPISGGHGLVGRDLTVVAAGLDSGSAYHFRFVASNPAGASVGADHTVAPPQASDRFYELVTAGDGQGAGVIPERLAISDDGERATFIAIAFGEQPSSPFITNPNISARDPENGWQARAMLPDPDHAAGSLNGAGDAGLSKRLWPGQSSADAEQAKSHWVLRGLDGSLRQASNALTPLNRVGKVNYRLQGASYDLSAFAFGLPGDFTSGATLFPDETLVASQGPEYSNLYAVTGAGGLSPTLSLVNRANDNSVIGGACGARLGGELAAGESGVPLRSRAISADGLTMYFSARAGAAAGGFCDTAKPIRLFKRIDQASTISVSESQCTRVSPPCSAADGDDLYWGASADGSKAFFSTSRQLVGNPSDPGDTDATSDLYLYDSSPPAGKPNLVQVSAGEVVAGDHPAIGSGANVLGVSDLSMDGSRVYFVATGRLTTEATQGSNNLYVYERDAAHPDGRIAFVATLAAGLTDPLGSRDSDLWNRFNTLGNEGKAVYALPYYDGLGPSRGFGDGHLLLFASEAQLLPADQDAFDDIYRYDDTAAPGSRLACLSCLGDQAIATRIYGRQIGQSLGDEVQRQRIASEDGSKIVFTTEEQLLPEDTNSVPDVYLWDEGQLSLVSAATGASGVVGAGGVGGGASGNVGGPAISPDGQSVFFETRATLLPQDINNGGFDFYVARVGGGFPQEETRVPCGSEEECSGQPPLSPPPSPVLSEQPGESNTLTPKPCPKHKVRDKHGKCVKKHHKPKKHHGKKHRKSGRAGR